MHHFDIPYRPSDFIQRNGRIDRQGNEQKKVELNTYISKGSIDSYSKMIVADKENWINQLLNTKSNVFANPDEGFDENALEIALAEEFDPPERVEEIRLEIAEKKEKAELDYNKDQVDKILPKYELISGAIWEYKGDKGSQTYQNMLRKRDEYRKDLEKNPEFKHPELLKAEWPFFFERETGNIYREGDYFTSKRGIHKLTKVNPKKATMTLTPIDETWKKTQGDGYSSRGRGWQTPPDHTGYVIKGKLPSNIRYTPEVKTPERLSEMETVFADDTNGFFEQPLDFQIKNYEDFFKNRKKEDIPFYFHERDGKLILDVLSYSDEPKNISNPVHPEKAGKEFKIRLLDGTAAIEISEYGNDDKKVIAKVGKSTWNDWKKAEKQAVHPWLPEAYKYLDKWISRGDLEENLKDNEDFKNDTSSNKMKDALDIPDIESKVLDETRYYIKKSKLKRNMDTAEYEIFEIASRNSQLSIENLKTAQSKFFKDLDAITWDINEYPKYYKDDVSKNLDKNLSVKGADNEKTANDLMPVLKMYYRKKDKILFDEENEIRKSQGMEPLIEMPDEDIIKNLNKQIDGFRAEKMAEYKPQGEEAAKYFTLKDMVEKLDDYKLERELTEVVKLNADNKKDIERVTKQYINEKKEEFEKEFDTFLESHNQKIKDSISKFLSSNDKSKIEISELRESLPFHTPISDSDFREILIDMQDSNGFEVQGEDIRIKNAAEIDKLKSINDKISRISNDLGLDESKLRNMMSYGLTESNINEYGRFDDLKETVDKSKAKEYFEKLEGATIPPFKINIRIHNLLQDFIIGEKPEKKPEPPPKEELADTDRPEKETINTEDTDLNIADFEHTKTGEIFRLVKMADQVSKDRFYEMKAKAKDFNGYYNRYSKGFMFKDPVDARNFAKSFEV